MATPAGAAVAGLCSHEFTAPSAFGGSPRAAPPPSLPTPLSSCAGAIAGALKALPFGGEKLGSSSPNGTWCTRDVSSLLEIFDTAKDLALAPCLGEKRGAGTLEIATKTDSQTISGGEDADPTLGGALLLHVENLSFARLAAVSGLRDRCQAAVREAASCETGGLGLEADEVELLGSDAATQFIVTLARSLPLQKLRQIASTSEASFGRLAVSKLTSLDGAVPAMIDAVCYHEVSRLVPKTLVRFQGAWEKDGVLYHIRGHMVHFPNSGVAQIIASDSEHFSITHPSGIAFYATLSQSGQHLSWRNGSVWSRLARTDRRNPGNGVPLVELGAPDDCAAKASPTPQLGEKRLRRADDVRQGMSAPSMWGVTGKQCRQMLRDLRDEPMWRGGGTMEELVATFIAPRTKGAGLGYAMLLNQYEPLRAESLVLHAAGVDAEGLLEVIARSVDDSEVIFLGALSLYHAEDAHGPSLAAQLGPCAAPAPGDVVAAQDVAMGVGASLAGGQAAELALAAMQAQVATTRRQRAFFSRLAWLHVVLAAVAALCACVPATIWGCVPSPDFARCGARRPLQTLSWSELQEWEWSRCYEDDLSNAPPWVRTHLQLLYPIAGATGLAAALLLLMSRRCGPQGGRVLVVPGRWPSRGVEDPAAERYGLDAVAGQLVLRARELGVPVRFADGVVVPWRFRKTHPCAKPSKKKPKSSPAEVAQVSDTASSQIEVVDGSPEPPVMETVPSAEEAAAPEPAPSEPEAEDVVVLRLAAQAARRSQAWTVVRWALLLSVLRLTDVSLAFGGAWRRNEACLCLLGTILAVAVSTAAMMTLARRCGGIFPLWLALALPGAFLAAGNMILALMTHFGAIDLDGISSRGRGWTGVLDLILDEFARHTSRGECASNSACLMAVFFFASFAQTLLVAGTSSLVVAISAACCPRHLARLSMWAAICFLVSLAASLALALWRWGYQADGLGGMEENMPQAEFGFAVAVYMGIQTSARFAAPVCMVLALTAKWGLRVVLPCRRMFACQRRRRRSRSHITSLTRRGVAAALAEEGDPKGGRGRGTA